MDKINGILSKNCGIDILVGIPSFNNAQTIEYVIKQAANGLEEHFPKMKGIIVVSDGNSTDKTREIAEEVSLPKNVDKIVTTYPGIPGKGSAIKLILQIAEKLNCKALALIDADLRSITSEWIRLLIQPVFEGVHFVAPRYSRYKYDGTITNQVAYPFTLTLFGYKIRQPIGGDFGLSNDLVKLLIQTPLWNTEFVPRFGIDITITFTALANNMKVGEAFLGAKVHDVKDPAAHLGPMFKQVVGALFDNACLYDSIWRNITHVIEPKIFKGKIEEKKPQPFNVNIKVMEETFVNGFNDKKEMLKNILSEQIFERLNNSVKECRISVEDWAKISFHFLRYYRYCSKNLKEEILETYKICWLGRVATFVKETLDMQDEEAEEKVNKEALNFMKLKPYLLSIWS
ncbi:MAG: glycosyltransferase [Nitrososphaeria archaeon]